MGGRIWCPGPKDGWVPSSICSCLRLYLEADLPGFRAEADTAGGWVPRVVSAWNLQAEISPHVCMGKLRHK